MPVIGYLENNVVIKGVKEMVLHKGAISYCCNKSKAQLHQTWSVPWDAV